MPDLCPAVYLASPLGFAASTQAYRQALLGAVNGAGWEALDPWDDPGGAFAASLAAAAGIAEQAERRRRLAELDMGAGRRNHALLDRADAVLAVLDGVDVDSGTASEIGYGAGRGLPVIGLRTDLRRTGENEGCLVNLQVEYFVRLNGGQMVTDLDQAVAALRELAARR